MEFQQVETPKKWEIENHLNQWPVKSYETFQTIDTFHLIPSQNFWYFYVSGAGVEKASRLEYILITSFHEWKEFFVPYFLN